MMDSMGFKDRSQSPVYISANNIIFFGAVHINGFNACGPFISNPGTGIIAPLLEGPGIVGLAFLCNSLLQSNPNLSKQTVADAMLPAGSIDGNGWGFKFNANGFAEYPTNSGKMRIDYTNTAPGKGDITLLSSDFQGGKLAGGNYQLAYA
jgi:hypothetical protein